MVAHPAHAEDVKGADDHHRQALLPVIAESQVLRRQLADAVAPPHVLDRGKGRVGVFRDTEGIGAKDLAGGEADHPLAVMILGNGLEQVGGAGIVHLQGIQGVADNLLDAHHGRHVDHYPGVGYRLGQRRRIQDIDLGQLDVFMAL